MKLLMMLLCKGACAPVTHPRSGVPACKIRNLKVGSVPTVYPADSRTVFCEVCNDAIIAKHCELKMHKVAKALRQD